MNDPVQPEVKRGPGRPPNNPPSAPALPVVKPAEKPAEKPTTTNVTYVPQEAGDPAVTVWNGHTFHANKPTPVGNHHEKMLDQARGNRWFKVEGHDPGVEDKKSGVMPEDSDAYRRYVVAWFKAADWYKKRPSPDQQPGPNSAEFKARWESEDNLRKSCGVGTDDLEYLDKLYAPRLAELIKAES